MAIGTISGYWIRVKKSISDIPHNSLAGSDLEFVASSCFVEAAGSRPQMQRRRGCRQEVRHAEEVRTKTGEEETAGMLGQRSRAGGGEGEELQKQEEGAEPDAAAVLLFEADAAQVPVVDADDAVVLLEEALLLRLAPPLQTLDQQAQSPARAKEAREPAWKKPGSGTASTPAPAPARAAAGSAPTLRLGAGSAY